jgi:hypothetical protein
MQVIPEADIAMFARGLLGRHGPHALRYAKDRSRRLAKVKDDEGAVVWTRVADAVADRMAKRESGAS